MSGLVRFTENFGNAGRAITLNALAIVQLMPLPGGPGCRIFLASRELSVIDNYDDVVREVSEALA